MPGASTGARSSQTAAHSAPAERMAHHASEHSPDVSVAPGHITAPEQLSQAFAGTALSTGLPPNGTLPQGRGNGPARAAMLLNMQRTVGNRAVQNFLQRTRSSSPSAVRPTVRPAVQRCNGEVHEGCGCALDKKDVEMLPSGSTTLQRRQGGVALPVQRDPQPAPKPGGSPNMSGSNAPATMNTPQPNASVPPAATPAPPVAQGDTFDFQGEKLAVGDDYLKYVSEKVAAKEGVSGFTPWVNSFEADLKAKKEQIASNDKMKQEQDTHGKGDVSGAPLSGGTLSSAQTEAKIGDEVLKSLRSQQTRLEGDERDFLDAFQSWAKLTATNLLDESKSRVESEQKRYGIRQAGEHHAMAQNNDTKELNQAAKQLLGLRAPIEPLHERLRQISIAPPNGDHNAAAQEQLKIQADFADKAIPYLTKEVELEAKFPILASYAKLPKLEDDWTGTATGLKTLSEGSGRDKADLIGGEITDKLTNIKTFHDALESGEASIYLYDRLVSVTKARMKVQDNPLRVRMVQDKVGKETKEHASKNEWLTALNFAIMVVGTVATIATGGLAAPIALAGTAAASAAISGYLTLEEIRSYKLAAAASGTDFDKARALSDEDPSLLPVIMSVAGLVLDVVAAGAAFSRLIRVINSARTIAEVETAAKAEAAALKAQGKLTPEASEADFAGRVKASTERLVAAEEASMGGAGQAGGSSGAKDDGKLLRKGNRRVLNQGPDPTCGPIACAMALDTMGRKVDAALISEVVKIASSKGTWGHQLVDLFKKYGITVAERMGIGVSGLASATKGGNPAIALIKVRIDSAGKPLASEGLHWVVVDGVTERMGQQVVAVRNPWGSQYFEPVAQFEKNFTGQAIEIMHANY